MTVLTVRTAAAAVVRAAAPAAVQTEVSCYIATLSVPMPWWLLLLVFLLGAQLRLLLHAVVEHVSETLRAAKYSGIK